MKNYYFNAFFKDCINNLFWSLSLIIIYLGSSFNFLIQEEEIPAITALIHLIGFLVGLVFMISINFFYFLNTNKDLHKLSGGKYKPEKENPIKVAFHKKINWEKVFGKEIGWGQSNHNLIRKWKS